VNFADENQILSTGTESHDDGEGAWNVATSRRAKRRRRRSSQEKIGGGSSVVGDIGGADVAIALSSSTPSRSVGHHSHSERCTCSYIKLRWSSCYLPTLIYLPGTAAKSYVRKVVYCIDNVSTSVGEGAVREFVVNNGIGVLSCHLVYPDGNWNQALFRMLGIRSGCVVVPGLCVRTSDIECGMAMDGLIAAGALICSLPTTGSGSREKIVPGPPSRHKEERGGLSPSLAGKVAAGAPSTETTDLVSSETPSGVARELTPFTGPRIYISPICSVRGKPNRQADKADRLAQPRKTACSSPNSPKDNSNYRLPFLKPTSTTQIFTTQRYFIQKRYLNDC